VRRAANSSPAVLHLAAILAEVGVTPTTAVFLPTGVMVHDGRLVVADAWHHRILVSDAVPATNGVAPDLVLGQRALDGVGEGCGPDRFSWAYGPAACGDHVAIADSGNNRGTVWNVPA
jgi:hypothetical protein